MRRPKVLILAAALAACACESGATAAEPPRARRAATPSSVALSRAPSLGSEMTALDPLPWDERIALERTLALSDTRFMPRMDEGGPVLETPGSALASFSASGAALTFGRHAATLRVAALGREGALAPLAATARPEVVGPEVRTARAEGVIEWWRSLPSGLEHGITVAERPAGNGELQLEVAVAGELSAHLLSDDAVELRDEAGVRIATYGHLVVLDVAGARVPARMSMDGGRIVLGIDDAGARYPLLVDPLVTAQEATLLAPDGAASDYFGVSVALSSDGSRALVGADADDTTRGSNAGSARVLVRTGTTWTEEATLSAPDGAANDYFGRSVALSADGSLALVGVELDDTVRGADAGSVRVFARTGTTWAEEATLLAPDGAVNDYFGISVALSSDGSRAIVGASYDDTPGGTDAGSARVFLRTGTTWAEEATLVAPDGAANDYFGRSVALAADASRALVGANADDTAAGSGAGSARVFLRTGPGWAPEATLLASDGAAGDALGRSVALSADASRALVGADRDDTVSGSNAGSARMFLRAGTAWTEEATLVAPDGAANENFGLSVALSSDGSRGLVGTDQDDTAGGVDAGSARVFLRAGSVWTHEATLLAPDGAAYDYAGHSVALASDGSRALVGADRDDTVGGTDAGSARVFTIALAPDGAACSSDAPCMSGFCVDGVCCDTRCGSGASDCQACSAALTGGTSGTCAALSGPVAPTVVCRAATDVCDAAERCTSASTTCPVDTLAAASTPCRASVGACDIAETCTGASSSCPADALAPSGAICGPPAGACDRAEVCSGASTACPADLIETAGTVCRAATAGGCDRAEVCSGATVNCPGDGFAGAGTVCRSIGGACDVEEVCAGTSPDCPADVVRVSVVVCRAAATACDVPESCTGATPECPADLFAPVTTSCGPGVSDVCDAPDHCAGTSANCVDTYLDGVECRASRGACDIAESCPGAGASCPPDARVSSGIACRPSAEPLCDPEEVCDGTSTSCPADVTMCSAGDAGPRDAAVGDDASPGSDAGGSSDAGTAPVATAGCLCRLTPSRAPPLSALLALILVATLRSGRRTRCRLASTLAACASSSPRPRDGLARRPAER